jgi:hypothetical protein
MVYNVSDLEQIMCIRMCYDTFVVLDAFDIDVCLHLGKKKYRDAYESFPITNVLPCNLFIICIVALCPHICNIISCNYSFLW